MIHRTRVYRKHTGFTIPELIIVILVIGILVSIAVVSYSGYRTRAAKSSADSTVQQVKLKLGEYYTDNNRYPASSGDVSTYLTSVQATSTATAFTAIISGGGTYVATPSGCVTSGVGTLCSGYTITVPVSYWSGGSTDTAITVTP